MSTGGQLNKLWGFNTLKYVEAFKVFYLKKI